MAKRLKKMLAMLLTLAMVLSMMSIPAFAAEGGFFFASAKPVTYEGSANEDKSIAADYICGEEEHKHNDECYKAELICQLHVHDENCGADCAQEVVMELTCGEKEHEHDEDCKHVHNDECCPLICDVQYECENTEEGHDHAAMRSVKRNWTAPRKNTSIMMSVTRLTSMMMTAMKALWSAI